MRNVMYRPALPLGCFVRAIWYYDEYTTAHALERILPDGSMGLIVNLAEDCVRIYGRDDHSGCERLSGSIVMGAHSRFFVIDTAEQRCVLGVMFRAGGAAPFFDMPVDEIQGRHISLEDIWGADARRLRERLIEIPGGMGKCQLMEGELIRRAGNRLELRREIDFAVRELGCSGRTVPDVINQLGLSSRRFRDSFRSAVGLTPKTFSRVRRFQAVLRSVEKSIEIDWTEIALSCGYFDQAHFNHDFRAFSGINPSAYLARRTPHINHVPIA